MLGSDEFTIIGLKIKMASRQSKKPNKPEKKLYTLKHQLYGKEADELTSPQHKAPEFSLKSTPVSSKTGQSPKTAAETGYLRQDLMKIFFLATLAIGAQILIYLAINNQLPGLV